MQVFKLFWTLVYSSFNSCWLYSISEFPSLVATPVGITSSTICAITVGIKKCKSIIKKKKKKHDKTVLLGKDKLNTIEVLRP